MTTISLEVLNSLISTRVDTSIINPTGRKIKLYCSEFVTIDSAESTIIFNSLGDSEIYFESYSKTYGDIEINPNEGISLFYNNNSFHSLSIIGDGAINFNLEFGETTQTIIKESGLTLIGLTPGGLRLNRIGSGSWSISMSSGTVNATNCTISNSTAEGGATFNALVDNGNIDGGGNTGWNF
jgi:hypothetical protein